MNPSRQHRRETPAEYGTSRITGRRLGRREQRPGGAAPSRRERDDQPDPRRARQSVAVLTAEQASDRVKVAKAHALGSLRWRRHRCGSCGDPWMAQGRRLDGKCPRCGSSCVSEESPC
jgi:rubrerythrin